MSEKFILSIPGRPVPWARAGTTKGIFYTPKTQRAHRKHFVEFIHEAMRDYGTKPFTGAVWVSLRFVYGKEPRTDIAVMPVRVGANVIPQTLEFHQPPGYEFHTAKRPDCDNLAKQIFEILQDSDLLEDDGQVVGFIAAKLKRR